MNTAIYRTVVVVASVLLAASVALADWPQWRGPLGTGYVPAGTAVPDTLASPVKTRWAIKVGFALSSPVVAGGRVFHMDNVAGIETLHALSESDGKPLWSVGIDQATQDTQSDSGPRCTPVVDGDRVYAQSCRGQLKCLSVVDGKLLWQVSYTKDFRASFIGEKGRATGAERHGYAGAPIVDGSRLIAGVGGPNGFGVVAFDKLTGKVLFHSQDDIPGYAPPVIATIAGVRQIIEFTAEGAIGLDASDGRLLWRVPIKTSFGRHAATPIVDGDMVVVSSHQAGLMGIRVSRSADGLTAERAWTARNLAINYASPVLVGHHLYGVGPRRDLMCVDTATGKPAWTKDGLFFTSSGKTYAGMIVMQRRILMLTDSGQLILFDADPAGYHEISRAQACGANWCNPAYSDGAIFMRDAKELRCVQLMP